MGLGSVLLKLSLSGIVGLILGIERESKHKPLGIKTCAVIAIASCLLTIVSMQAAFDSHNGEFFIRADPMRLAAQIISGVGFLGAGVILRRNNDVISGLTTAAIVWAASGFGIAIGAGYYLEVTVGLLLMFVVLSFLPHTIKKVGPDVLREQEVRLNIYVDPTEDINQVIKELETLVTDIKDLKIKGRNEEVKIEMRCIIIEGAASLFDHYSKISVMPGVERVEIEGI